MNLSCLNLDLNFVTCVLSNFNFVLVLAFFWPTKGPYYYYYYTFLDKGPQLKKGSYLELLGDCPSRLYAWIQNVCWISHLSSILGNFLRKIKKSVKKRFESFFHKKFPKIVYIKCLNYNLIPWIVQINLHWIIWI